MSFYSSWKQENVPTKSRTHKIIWNKKLFFLNALFTTLVFSLSWLIFISRYVLFSCQKFCAHVDPGLSSGACRYGVLLRLQKPTWRTLAVRAWELVLYKYDNFGLLQSECPDSSGPYRPAPRCLASAGSIPPGHSAFCSFFFSLDPFFFSRYSTRSASIFCFITSLYKNGALSLYFTIIADTNISMHGYSMQGYKRSLLECSALPGKDQKLSLGRKAVFHTGNEHWKLQSY